MAVEIRVLANTRDAERQIRRLEQGVEGLANNAESTSRSLRDVGRAVGPATRGTQSLNSAVRNAAGAAGDLMRSAQGASEAVRDLGSSQNRRDLSSLEQATNRTADAAERGADSFERASNGLRNFVAVTAALGAAYLTVRNGILGASDALTRINSQLRLVTDTTAEATAAQRQLIVLSRDTRTTLSGTAQLYSRFARAGRTLNRSQEEIIAVTENVNRAITISGASAESANAAIIQLGQGLASGTLRGEELNSVLEQTPRVARAIADGLGVSIGRLRELGAEGALTSAAVFDAIRTQGAALRSEFENVTVTFEQATQRIGQALQLIGAGVARGFGRIFGSATRGAVNFAMVLENLADNIDATFDNILLTFLEFRVNVRTLFRDIGRIVRQSDLGRFIASGFQQIQNNLPRIDFGHFLTFSIEDVRNTFQRFWNFLERGFNDLYIFLVGGSVWTDTVNDIRDFAGRALDQTLVHFRSFASDVRDVFQQLFGGNGSLAGFFSGGRSELVVTTRGDDQSGFSALSLLPPAINGLSGVLNVAVSAINGIRETIGNINFAGLVGAIALLSDSFRNFAARAAAPGQFVGGAAARAVRATGLERSTDQLRTQLVALSQIARVDTQELREFNQALAAQAEIAQRRTAIENRLRDATSLSSQETQGLNAELQRLTGQLNAVDARVQQQIATEQRRLGIVGAATDQQRARARADLGRATANLQAQESQLRQIREQQAATLTNIVQGSVNLGQGIGGAIGGVAGFQFGEDIADALESRVGDLPAWGRAGVQIGTAFVAQSVGAAAGGVIGAVIGAALARAVVVSSAVTGPIGAAFAGLGRIIAASVAVSLPNLIGAAIGTAVLGLTTAIGAVIIGPAATRRLAEALGFSPATVESITDFLDPPWVQELRQGIMDFGGFIHEMEMAIAGFGDSISDFVSTPVNSVRNFFGGLSDRIGRAAVGNEGVPRFQTGGRVRGPGTGRSDDIMARLSNGEFVVNAASTREHLPLLEAINRGEMVPRFQDGGLIGDRDEIVAHLREFEGYVRHIYADQRGLPTIGIGHLLTPRDISSGRFFIGSDPLAAPYQNFNQRVLGSLFDQGGLQSEYRRPSVRLLRAGAENIAIEDYGRNLGRLLSNGNFSEIYQAAAEPAQRVLADLAFNLGPSFTRSFPGFTRAIRGGDYSRAAGELRDSLYYYQTGRRARANINTLGELGGGIDSVGLGEARLTRIVQRAVAQGFTRNVQRAFNIPQEDGGLMGAQIADELARRLDIQQAPAEPTSVRELISVIGDRLPTRQEYSLLRQFATAGRFQDGGSVSGPGTGRSDSIPAFLSNGEFVINARAASRYRELLEFINGGSGGGASVQFGASFKNGGLIPRFQNGGLVEDLDSETRRLLGPSSLSLVESASERAARIGRQEAERAVALDAQNAAAARESRIGSGALTEGLDEEARLQREVQRYIARQAGNTLRNYVESNYGGLVEDIQQQVESTIENNRIAQAGAGTAALAAFASGNQTFETDGAFRGVNYRLEAGVDRFNAVIDTMLGGGVLTGRINQDGEASVEYNRSIGEFARFTAEAERDRVFAGITARFRNGGLAGLLPGFQNGGIAVTSENIFDILGTTTRGRQFITGIENSASNPQLQTELIRLAFEYAETLSSAMDPAPMAEQSGNLIRQGVDTLRNTSRDRRAIYDDIIRRNFQDGGLVAEDEERLRQTSFADSDAALPRNQRALNSRLNSQISSLIGDFDSRAAAFGSDFTSTLLDSDAFAGRFSWQRDGESYDFNVTTPRIPRSGDGAQPYAISLHELGHANSVISAIEQSGGNTRQGIANILSGQADRDLNRLLIETVANVYARQNSLLPQEDIDPVIRRSQASYLRSRGANLDNDLLAAAPAILEVFRGRLPEEILRAIPMVMYETADRFQNGGRVRGPGTGRSDSIMARLSNGEFVVNAEATRRNLPLLAAINGGLNPGGERGRFQNGGLNTGDSGEGGFFSSLLSINQTANEQAEARERLAQEQAALLAAIATRQDAQAQRVVEQTAVIREAASEQAAAAAAAPAAIETAVEEGTTVAQRRLNTAEEIAAAINAFQVQRELSRGQFGAGIDEDRLAEQLRTDDALLTELRPLIESLGRAQDVAQAELDLGEVSRITEAVVGSTGDRLVAAVNEALPRLGAASGPAAFQGVGESAAATNIALGVDSERGVLTGGVGTGGFFDNLAANLAAAGLADSDASNDFDRTGARVSGEEAGAARARQAGGFTREAIAGIGTGAPADPAGAAMAGLATGMTAGIEGAMGAAGSPLDSLLPTDDQIMETGTERGNLLGRILGESYQNTVEATAMQADPTTLLTDSLGALSSYSEDAFRANQALQVANATINGIAAVQAALSAAPPPFNFALAALVGAAQIANVNAIRSQQFQGPSFQTGGFVSGPGTGTSDSISAQLSNGEFVVRADQTAQNRELLEDINAGNGPVSGSGGYVANQQINVEVGGVSRSARQTADTVVPAVVDAIQQTRRDRTGEGSRRRPR